MRTRLPAIAFLWIVATALLAGCARGPKPDDIARPSGLAMTLNGLGPIDAATPFDADEVATQLPNFDVEWARYGAKATSDEDVVVVLVSRDGRTVAEFHSDASGASVGRIDALSNVVEGPYGERVGDALASVRAPGIRCTPGDDISAGTALCVSRGSTRIAYLVQHDHRQANELPPREQLNEAPLTRIIWTAD